MVHHGNPHPTSEHSSNCVWVFLFLHNVLFLIIDSQRPDKWVKLHVHFFILCYYFTFPKAIKTYIAIALHGSYTAF